MKALLFRPAAEGDLGSIWDYSFETWGLAQAEQYILEIRDTCRMLASGEKRGRGVDIRQGYRKEACGAHMIYFRETETEIEVVRILHGRQDVERQIMG